MVPAARQLTYVYRLIADYKRSAYLEPCRVHASLEEPGERTTMASLIDFAALDLRGAFDFAIMIEEDAQVRYERLSRLLGQDPGGAGDVFRMMVVNEGKHRSDLISRRDTLFRNHAPRIAISVLDEGVEAPDVDDDELPRTAREALEVSLAAERRAYEFFGAAIPHIVDPGVRAFFQGLKQEEAEHAALIARKIAELGGSGDGGEDQAPPARDVERTVAAETYPDRALLETALPRFDAATQAVAVGAIVEGMKPGELAAALGVSRRTVGRKLTRFLAIARRHVAAAVAVATLASCAGSLPQTGGLARSAEQEPPRPAPAAGFSLSPAGGEGGVRELLAMPTFDPRPGPPSSRGRQTPRSPLPGALEQDCDEPKELAEHIYAQVAARMPRLAPAVHGRVARAIVAEAELASVDPLLVLALIHVESSFDPSVVSEAGAVGLMQLLEPTMRREMARSGLRVADPLDPVANVQAGVRYLRRLIDAFGGEVDVALMAYNAGPSRIRGHQRRGEIPKRFRVYPRRVNSELERLRRAMGARATRLVATKGSGPRSLG
jgi:hypothetical protein